MKGKVTYLALQSTREGQAGYAHVHEIVNNLQELGWQVQLFEPLYHNNKTPGIGRRLLEMIKTQVLSWKSGLRAADVIYIRLHIGSLPTALLAKLFNKPVVQEVNGIYSDLFIAWPQLRRLAGFFNWVIRIQMKCAEAVITVTPQLKEWVKKESGHELVEVIPNGANLNIFNPHAVSQYDCPDSYVIFFGALARWQGINTILSAVEQAEWPQDVHVVIVGEGVEQNLVEEKAKENSSILYLGRLPYRELPGLIAKSLAALSPKLNVDNNANFDCSPLKVYEALACGVPAVVTDFPGQAELIRNYDCGIVIPPEDDTALARAVNYLYNQPEESRAMGSRGQNAIRKEHSWMSRAEDTEIVLRKVL